MKHAVTKDSLDDLRFNDDGLIPVVAQDQSTGAVLMLAWANREALRASLATGRMTYFSRSRQSLWVKGETSGHAQRVIALSADCDKDSILAVVEQSGPACHENTGTCWTDREESPVATMLGVLDRLAADRQGTPQSGWTDRLLSDPELVASKIEEEAAEVAAVLRGQDNDDTLEHEAADLLYHLVVGLRGGQSNLAAVMRELAKRHR